MVGKDEYNFNNWMMGGNLSKHNTQIATLLVQTA
jgi:hypothetical protein